MGILSKKIATVLLLAIVLAPLSYHFIFEVKQSNVQGRMKKQLEGNMLHSLVMKKAELRWVKPGKEILVGEKMFDIKTIEYRNNGTAFITGLFDHEESFLLQQMKNSRQEESDRNNQQIVQLFQLMQALPDNGQEQVASPAVSPEHSCIFTDDLLPSPIKNILTPPPQC